MGNAALRDTVARREEQALRSGALRPIATETVFMVDDGVRFVLRVAANLARREADDRLRQAESASADKETNPFLPYDPAMFVADLSPTHVCLFNKFNVLAHHLLMVTRAFEPQESALSLQDFEALGRCMTAFDGLGFYNSSTTAGASQAHKHLQLVPLPLAEGGLPVAMAAKLPLDTSADQPVEVTSLPFANAFLRLPTGTGQDLRQTAQASLHGYRALMRLTGILDGARAARGEAPLPYNLLLTRQWMLLVPRARERFDGISVNALGFAGSLFVRDRDMLRRLQRAGPFRVLREVGVERR